ncbi:hypothetical protein [Microbacterium sp.]|uniref:hypothetical protein n=1 Tax=Microbacterium sp. TaxID=51671 RepID=UPI00261629EC|nr:hypothetical protein [Microbacterium sp.]
MTTRHDATKLANRLYALHQQIMRNEHEGISALVSELQPGLDEQYGKMMQSEADGAFATARLARRRMRGIIESAQVLGIEEETSAIYHELVATAAS